MTCSLRSESLLGRVIRAPLRLVPKGMVVPILRGPLRGSRWVVGAGTHGCWLGTYELDKMRLFARTLRRGQVVYDIGANVGIYTLLASARVGQTGRVFAFEPLPSNLGHLRRHADMNGCANVVVLACAVSDRTGRARFVSTAGSHQGYLGEKGEIEVETATLDGLLASGTLVPPAVVKVDVEGAEDRVLAGAEAVVATHRPVFFLATHGAAVHRWCCEWLRERGYALRALGGGALESAEELLALPG